MKEKDRRFQKFRVLAEKMGMVFQTCEIQKKRTTALLIPLSIDVRFRVLHKTLYKLVLLSFAYQLNFGLSFRRTLCFLTRGILIQKRSSKSQTGEILFCDLFIKPSLTHTHLKACKDLNWHSKLDTEHEYFTIK